MHGHTPLGGGDGLEWHFKPSQDTFLLSGLFLLPQKASKLRNSMTSLQSNFNRRILTSWVIQSEHDLYPSQSFVLFVLFTLLQMRLPQNVQYFHFLISYVCPFHQ